MENNNHYQIIKSRYITEKTTVLEGLQSSQSNRCTAKCDKPKYVFIVEKGANKRQIAKAIEKIYSDKKIKVKKINTTNVKPKKRRVRGFKGFKSGYKKAIVTLEKGDSIEEAV